MGKAECGLMNDLTLRRASQRDRRPYSPHQSRRRGHRGAVPLKLNPQEEPHAGHASLEKLFASVEYQQRPADFPRVITDNLTIRTQRQGFVLEKFIRTSIFPQFHNPRCPFVQRESVNTGAVTLACTSGLMGNVGSISAGSLTVSRFQGSHHALAHYSQELPDSTG
ncbi:uncharacterized [Tachysurus ichikawai]